jgi:Mrp family chromosome partitioning ATPase
MVIFDSPPVIGLSDAPLLGSVVECYIIVASARKTPKSAIRGAIKRMAQANAKPMGAVLNRVDTRNTGYGYGYGYGATGKDGADPFVYGVSPPAKALTDRQRAVKA